MKNKKFFKMAATLVGLILLAIAAEFFLEKREEDTQPVIGVLQFTSHPALDEIYRGILEGLRDEGFEEGKTAKILFQNGQGDQSKLTTMSQTLIQDRSNILIGIATPAAQALANGTNEIPIILGAISDPEGAGLVASNEKPGGNVTGVSDRSPVRSQFELMKELLPDAKKVGILISLSEDNSRYQGEEAKKVAEELGFDVEIKGVPSSNEIAQTVQSMANDDVIYIPTDNTIANAMQTVVGEANKSKTPVFPSVDTMVEEGGLATVSINQYELGLQTGKMAGEVLKGEAKTEDTPIYTFKTGETIINQKQASFLGIPIPEKVLKNAKIVN